MTPGLGASRLRRWFFALGLLLVVVPLVAGLGSTFHDGPPAPRGATAREARAEDPTPPSRAVQAARWSLVAMPVGAALVVKLGVRRRRSEPSPTGSYVYGVFAATALAALLLSVVVIGVLYTGPLGYGSVLVLEVVALVAWWQLAAFVRAVRLYPKVGRDPEWEPPEDLDEDPLLPTGPIMTTGAAAPPPPEGPIVS